MSDAKKFQILKSLNDSKEISHLEHSPCFHPTMHFLNIITFHLLIAFGDLIWQCSKERSKFWLHEFNDLDPSLSKRFVWFLNTMIFQNGCSKDHILFQKKKKKWKIFFFQKKRKKKRNLISKKKKIHSFSKSSSLELRLDLILYKWGT